MANYNCENWQKSMKLRFDYNNMMAKYVGETEGLKENELTEMKTFAKEAFDKFTAIRGTGMTGWADLPYNQDEIVEDVIATAENIRKNFKYFVV